MTSRSEILGIENSAYRGARRTKNDGTKVSFRAILPNKTGKTNISIYSELLKRNVIALIRASKCTAVSVERESCRVVYDDSVGAECVEFTVYFHRKPKGEKVIFLQL